MHHVRQAALGAVLSTLPTLWAATDVRAQDAVKLTLVEAIERGKVGAGAGTVVHAELERDAGKLVYSIDVARDRVVINVVLDVRDGSVLERGEDAEDQRAVVAACKVSLTTAIANALARVPGQAVEARMLLPGGLPRIEVAVAAGKDGARRTVTVDGASGAVLEGGAAAPTAAQGPRFTDRFDVPPAELQPHGANPFFVLVPGHTLVLEGEDGGEPVQLVVRVLDETRDVAGVRCAVVEERESKGGKLVEVSRNFFAISRRTNDVYYFGEDVDIWRDGAVVGHDGAWLAGERGARFGLMMPGTPLLGARYHQEVAPDVAMDRAEVVSLDDVFDGPTGRYERVLKTEETTPLEKGTGFKLYAAGVGMVGDGELKLVRVGR